MSEIAILMAAGLGTRMRPITDDIPKPLVRVLDKPMIETVIDGLSKRGIDHFYIVTGYLGDQFQYLTEKYNNISLVENKYYNLINNISSIYTVSDLLVETAADVFICEADLFVNDDQIFEAELKRSVYYGKMVKGHSDDWVFDQDVNKRIIRVGKGGDDCYNMVGVAFFKNEDAKNLGKMIKDSWQCEGYEDLFWDDVVDKHLEDLDLIVYPVDDKQIIEIDTVQELAAIDTSYSLLIKKWKDSM